MDILSLVGCYIRPHGAECIGNALAKNKSLSEIDLSKNGIRDRGLKNLCGVNNIAQNKALMKLSLSDNNITTVANLAQQLQARISCDGSEMLTHEKENQGITELYLNNNTLEFDAAKDLAVALKESNRTLQKVLLNHNKFKVDSLWRLCSACIGHVSLRLLSLKGLKLGNNSRAELAEKTKYKMLEVLVDTPVKLEGVALEQQILEEAAREKERLIKKEKQIIEPLKKRDLF